MRNIALAWLRTPRSINVVKTTGGAVGILLALAAVVLLVFPQSLSLLGLRRGAADSAAPEEAAPLATVKLSQAHAEKAGLTIGRAELQTLQAAHAVPGKVSYDASRQLELRSPVDCVVKAVLVEVGSRVEPGAKLAVLTSSEIGLARDHVAKCEADLALARHEADWHREIDENLQDLLAELKQEPGLKSVEQRFSEQRLGAYRDKVLSAYSRLVLASLAIASTKPLEDQGVLAGRLAQERRSAKEVQAAHFQSVCETSRFESRQERELSQADAEQAERMLRISREKLKSLLGPFSEDTKTGVDESLNEFTLHAPFAGRVEERFLVNGARISAGQPLFSLADTSLLWVSAEIHERNWNALAVALGTDLAVRSPALPGREFQARVRFVGAKVNEESRSVPLVAELANPEGRFKPGMFLWVSAPVEEPRKTLAVRPAAVVRHDEQAFVFVPDGPETYRRVDVTTGLETSAWVEITSGLRPGQEVVEQGAALLKSELILPTLEE